MVEKITTYDPAKALNSIEAINVFLEDAFETGDSAYIAKALGIAAKAKGMSAIAKDTGLSREQLYTSLSDNGNPTLKTIVKIMHSLGLCLTVKHI